jgi:ketosteroid isomerase-like protein
MRVLFLIAAASLAATPVSAQQWTAEQTEVWTAVESMWKDYSSENLEAAFDDFSIVNAYVRGFMSEFGGEPTWFTMRWHSGWKKEGGRWLCVSNFIYSEPQVR